MSRSLVVLNVSGGAILLAALFATGKAHTATYHVATDGSGDFVTIAQVNAAPFRPGDLVLFRRGDTWREQLIISRSGSAGNPITFGAYGDAGQPLPKIYGSTLFGSPGSWTIVSGNIWRSTDRIGGATAENEVSNVIGGTYPNHACGIREGAYASLSARGQWFWNPAVAPYTYYLYVYSTGNPYTAYGDIEVAVEGTGGQSQLYISAPSYVTVQNLDIRYCGCHGIGTNWDSAVNQNNIIIENCSVSYCGGAGPAQGATRLGNGIVINNGGHDMTVRNNRVDQIFDGAIGVELQDSDATRNNTYIYNNIISNFDNGYFILAQPGDTVSNCYIENNTAVNAGMGWGDEQRMGAQSFRTHVFLCCNGGTPVLSSLYIRNNLFYGTKSHMVFYGWPTGSSEITVDYNCYYPAGASSFFIQNSGIYNFANWKNAIYAPSYINKGTDAHSINADPLLSSDFHLSGGSPCIDHATVNGCNRSTDYEGNTITGEPDIGAIESTGSFLLGVPSSTLPAVGDRFTFDMVCRPLSVRFDAYGVILTPEGEIYSFDLKNPGNLRAGVRPLALSVAGIRAVYRTTLCAIPSVPAQGKGNNFTFILGLVPAGAKPSVADVFPGCLWQGTVTVR